MIPENTDILVTHGPPYGVLDLNMHKQHTGCKDLLNQVLKIKPKLHVFGHIHEGYGVFKNENITFFNASSANIAYKLTNKPLVF